MFEIIAINVDPKTYVPVVHGSFTFSMEIFEDIQLLSDEIVGDILKKAFNDAFQRYKETHKGK